MLSQSSRKVLAKFSSLLFSCYCRYSRAVVGVLRVVDLRISKQFLTPSSSYRPLPLPPSPSRNHRRCPLSHHHQDLLFILYTSGSTGRPKGVAHTTAGYLLYTGMTTKHAFGLEEGDVFACVADVGWITGHSYIVYGPLVNGATSLMFESTPMYPNHGRWAERGEGQGGGLSQQLVVAFVWDVYIRRLMI